MGVVVSALHSQTRLTHLRALQHHSVSVLCVLLSDFLLQGIGLVRGCLKGLSKHPVTPQGQRYTHILDGVRLLPLPLAAFLPAGIKGRGEYVRLVFEDAGVPYTDAGVQQGGWAAVINGERLDRMSRGLLLQRGCGSSATHSLWAADRTWAEESPLPRVPKQKHLSGLATLTMVLNGRCLPTFLLCWLLCRQAFRRWLTLPSRVATRASQCVRHPSFSMETSRCAQQMWVGVWAMLGCRCLDLLAAAAVHFLVCCSHIL